MAHANEKVVKAYAAAAAEGDLDTARQYLADGVVYHVAGGHSLARDYHGPDEVVGFLGERSARTGGTLKVIPHDMLANDVHGVELSSVMAERDGVHYVWDVVAIYHLAGGRITECWVIDSDQDSAARTFA